MADVALPGNESSGCHSKRDIKEQIEFVFSGKLEYVIQCFLRW